MRPYLRFYLAVREAIESAYEKGINPKTLMIGEEEFRILKEEDSAIYNDDRSDMVYMNMDIQLSLESSLIQIDGLKKVMKKPIVIPQALSDVQIALFD